MIKKLLVAAALAGSLGSIAIPASSAVVIVQNAPPEPRNEAVPAPRRGYVWTPGYWDWRGKRHQWVKGSWVRERPGYAYRSPQWRENNGRWQLERGAWARGKRDRDGDGVRNNQDRRPNNPNRS